MNTSAANLTGGRLLATGVWAIPVLLSVLVWLVVTIKGPKTDRK